MIEAVNTGNKPRAERGRNSGGRGWTVFSMRVGKSIRPANNVGKKVGGEVFVTAAPQ